jgi:dTDP-4-amino-4,6-dideoxygalactose transaminase
MTPKDVFSRRNFLAASSGVLSAGGLSAQGANAAGAGASSLALHGGPKAVREPRPRRVRWGEPEREQLDTVVKQEGLFYWKGPQTALLIERFRKTYPLKYVQTTSSGTAALHVAVAAAGIGPGDEVITTPISDVGSLVGIIFQQAVPVFADLGRNTYNLDPADVERKITPKTKAILAVHLGGNPCDMTALKALADRRGLILIEDCAQAWGSTYRGRPVGTIGHIGCFSLQESKIITSGEGGVVASNDERIGPLLQRFGDKGINRLGKSVILEVFATNYRMSEEQAAFAAAQFLRLEGVAEKRARLGNLLTEKIRDLSCIEPYEVHPEDRCPYWLYMIRVREGSIKCSLDEFVKALDAEGVPAAKSYIAVPLYGNPVFQKHGFFAGRWPIKEMGLTSMDYSKVTCPEAEAILKTGVRIVIHEGMNESYIGEVAGAVRKVAGYYSA